MAGLGEVDLCSLDGLTKAVEHESPFGSEDLGAFDGTFCPSCSDVRRMQLGALHWKDDWTLDQGHRLSLREPALFAAICLQCDGLIVLLVLHRSGSPELVALPASYGGLATPNTPSSVAFYLDQADRCETAGALTAAVTMYRSALEHLLEEQGYTTRMLGPKIGALMDDPDPPGWRDTLDPEYLRIIRDLGNASTHTNGGDVSQQSVFETGLVREVKALFSELLDTIYEQPERAQSRLARLRQIASSFTDETTQ